MDKLRETVSLYAGIGGLALLTSGILFFTTTLVSSSCDALRIEMGAAAQVLLFLGIVWLGFVAWALTGPEEGSHSIWGRAGFGAFLVGCGVWFATGVANLPNVLEYFRFLVSLGLLLLFVATFTANPLSILRTHLRSFWGKSMLFAVLVFSLPIVIGANFFAWVPGSSDVLWMLLGFALAALGFHIARYRPPNREGVPFGKIRKNTKDTFDHIVGQADDPTRVTAEKYVDTLRENIKSTEESFRRILLLLFSLIVTFVVLELGIVRELTPLPGIKVSDYSFVQALLPLAVAYAYFELMSLIVLGTFSREAYRAILGKANEKIVEHNLDGYMLPSSSWSMLRVLMRVEGPVGLTTWVLTMLSLAAFVIGPLIFAYYAFSKVLEDFACSVPAWLILGASTSYLALGVIVIWQMLSRLAEADR